MPYPNHLEQETIGKVQPQETTDKAALESKIDQSRPAGDSSASDSPVTDAQQIKADLPEKSYQPHVEADAKLQMKETKNGTDRSIADSHLVDKAGRDITVRTWESGNHAYIRAYDGAKGTVPDRVDYGTAGRANVTLENQLDGSMHARLNDVEVNEQYQGAGISSEMLNKAELYAQNNNASEIYGSIDSDDARSFWKHMEGKGEGWTVDPTKGAYGEVHKSLA